MARGIYLDALAAASFAGNAATEVDVVQIAKAALAARPSETSRPTELLLDGVAIRITNGYGSGVPILKEALGALRRGEVSDEDQLRCSLLAYRSAVDLWDDESWYLLANRYVELARAGGALPTLHFALNALIVACSFAGERSTAHSLLAELRAVCEIIGSQVPPYAPLALLAWKGPEADAVALIEETERDAVARGETMAVSAARWASAVLHNGLGNYERALVAAAWARSNGDLGYADWSLPELILAAVRTGDVEQAADALQQLAERAVES